MEGGEEEHTIPPHPHPHPPFPPPLYLLTLLIQDPCAHKSHWAATYSMLGMHDVGLWPREMHFMEVDSHRRKAAVVGLK